MMFSWPGIDKVAVRGKDLWDLVEVAGTEGNSVSIQFSGDGVSLPAKTYPYFCLACGQSTNAMTWGEARGRKYTSPSCNPKLGWRRWCSQERNLLELFPEAAVLKQSARVQKSWERHSCKTKEMVKFVIMNVVLIQSDWPSSRHTGSSGERTLRFKIDMRQIHVFSLLSLCTMFRRCFEYTETEWTALFVL